MGDFGHGDHLFWRCAGGAADRAAGHPVQKAVADGRSIPKYLILSPGGEVLGDWGPRAPKVQEFVTEKRSVLPEKDDPQYDLHLKTVIGEISDGFTWNSDFWQAVYEDLRKTFFEVLK